MSSSSGSPSRPQSRTGAAATASGESSSSSPLSPSTLPSSPGVSSPPPPHPLHNISLGPKEDRVLMTGLHSVADISCNICKSTVGWVYIFAFEESQKYKEGKFIVEKAKIVKESPWIRNTM
ncbi:hypothetical protein BGW42_000400 [Actinomortierella wolfii]|nr:hypothetical protein BGW42_000400 [Actinomortierella wolfii]